MGVGDTEEFETGTEKVFLIVFGLKTTHLGASDSHSCLQQRQKIIANT